MKNLTFETLVNRMSILLFVVITLAIMFGVAIGRIHPTWIPFAELLTVISVTIGWSILRWY